MQAQQCITSCEAFGVSVMHGVDATCLPMVLPLAAYQRIIFNFPHSGSQRVHINRKLMQDFFTSCGYASSCTSPLSLALAHTQGSAAMTAAT